MIIFDENIKFVEVKFWKKSSSSFKVNAMLLQNFLEENGFRQYKEGYIVLRKNIAFRVDEKEIFKFCFEYVKLQNNNSLSDCFLRQGNNLMSFKYGLLNTLKVCEFERLRCSKDTTYIPFLNGIVKITSSESNLIPYEDLDSVFFVLSETIIQRNFNKKSEKSIMEEFISLVSECNKSKESIMSAIGYLLSDFKDPNNPKAIILTDFLSQSKAAAEGGTGKGLIVQAIKKMNIKVVTENGKNINFENSFVYQSVDHNTRLFFLDDVKQSFDFEYLFSIITNDFKIERKNKFPFSISFDDSPKILIATNYPVKGNTSSNKRRKHTIILDNFFNNKYTPFVHFNHTFFTDWKEEEWCRFDNFMIICAEVFLQNGLIEVANERLNRELIINLISLDLFEKLEGLELNKKYRIKVLGIERTNLITHYAEYKGYNLIKGISEGNTTIEFIKKSEINTNIVSSVSSTFYQK